MTAKRRATDLEALALKFAPPGATPAEESPPEPATRPTARIKKVRHTVDLSPTRHHDMETWCSDTAVQLGVARVPNQHVHDTLVGLLLTDKATETKILEKLREKYAP